MRNCIRFAPGIVVSGLILSCLWPVLSVGAAPPHPDGFSGPGGGRHSSGTAGIGPEWKLGAPVTSGNLTIFPVMASAWSGVDNFITLDEGLKSGKVTITELGSISGAGGRRSGDRAEVNTLSLTNKSGRMLILMAGEMLIGGKQDRIVDQDQLVPPDGLPVALGVFCVEHGRWHGTSAGFGQTQTTGRPQPPGANNFIAAGSGGAGGAGQIAMPSVREKAEARKDQGEVWSKVAETTRLLDATSSTGALTRAYQDGRVARRAQVYETQLRYRVPGRNVVGVVVAVSGRLVTADIFASPLLFQRYWPKLLTSYVLEAMGSSMAPGAIDRAAAEAFLSRAGQSSSSETRKSIYRLTEHKSGRDSSFELDYMAGAQPLLVHFNRIASR